MGQTLIVQPRSLIIPRRGFRKPARPVLDPYDPINSKLLHYWHYGGFQTTAGIERDLGSNPADGTAAFSAGAHIGAGHHGGQIAQWNGTTTDKVTYSGVFKDLAGIGSVSICFWVCPLGTLSDYAGFFEMQTSSSNNDLSAIAGGGGLNDSTAAAFVLRNGGNTYGYTATNIIPVGSSTFLAYVFNGGNSGNANRMAIWSNGVSNSLTFVGTIPATLPTSTVSPRTGAYSSATLNARLDALRIYGRPLSQSEILRLYAEPYAGIYESAPGWRVGGFQMADGAPVQPTLNFRRLR